MIIAVDFDGTIVDHRFPDIGAPVPGAIYWLKRFKEAGFKLVLWTMRSDGQSNGNVLTDALNYCSRMGVEFDGVNHSPGQDSWSTSPKAYALVYIDDAGFGCPLKDNPCCGGRPYVDWDVIGPAVLKQLLPEGELLMGLKGSHYMTIPAPIHVGEVTPDKVLETFKSCTSPNIESESCLRPVRVVKPARIAVKQSRVAKTARKAPVRVKVKRSLRVSKPKSGKRR